MHRCDWARQSQRCREWNRPTSESVERLHFLALNGSRSESRDKFLLERNEHDGDRQDADQRTRHHHFIVRTVHSNELVEADRNCKEIVVMKDDLRREEVIPCAMKLMRQNAPIMGLEILASLCPSRFETRNNRPVAPPEEIRREVEASTDGIGRFRTCSPCPAQSNPSTCQPYPYCYFGVSTTSIAAGLSTLSR